MTASLLKGIDKRIDGVCPGASWLAICLGFARLHEISEAHQRILAAFGALAADVLPAPSLPADFPPASMGFLTETEYELVTERRGYQQVSLLDDDIEEAFARLEAASLSMLEEITEAIGQTLQEEVDAPQAAMFGRRFVSVVALLETKDGTRYDTTRRLWLVGMVCRVVGLLKAPVPRALRVRAICDFYYSQAALLIHQVSGHLLPSLEASVASLSWRHCHGDATHATLSQLTSVGPLHINLLRAPAPRLHMLDCRDPEGTRPLAEIVAAHGAWAGISGGFFLYSEPDIQPPSRRTDPVGLLVHRGKVLNPPVFRRAALCQTETGALLVQSIDMCGVQVSWPGASGCQIQCTHDQTKLGQEVVAFNRARCQGLAPHTYPGFALVGTSVVAAGTGLQEIPLAGCLIVLPLGSAVPAAGTALTFVLPASDQGKIVEAMAGGPMLLSPEHPPLQLEAEDFCGDAPPVTFSQDETFDQNLLPRMAAGLSADGTLVLAAIDGRHFHKAPGLTLHLTSRLMQALGCVIAMNLDGGSSKRMVIGDSTVDLSSTEVMGSLASSATTKTGEARLRPVHSAILLCEW